MNEPLFHSEGVLAGAYRGRDIAERAMLRHAAPSVEFRSGRLARQVGSALCNATIDLAGDRGPMQATTCPRCIAILQRLGAN